MRAKYNSPPVEGWHGVPGWYVINLVYKSGFILCLTYIITAASLSNDYSAYTNLPPRPKVTPMQNLCKNR